MHCDKFIRLGPTLSLKSRIYSHAISAMYNMSGDVSHLVKKQFYIRAGEITVQVKHNLMFSGSTCRSAICRSPISTSFVHQMSLSPSAAGFVPAVSSPHSGYIWAPVRDRGRAVRPTAPLCRPEPAEGTGVSDGGRRPQLQPVCGEQIQKTTGNGQLRGITAVIGFNFLYPQVLYWSSQA